MPLLDHFRPPLSVRRHWEAFHHAWATYIASDLNQVLPEDYFAEPNVKFGIEIDVATFVEAGASSRREAPIDAGWVAPAPTQTIPITILTDLVEVLVFGREAGPTLAGAIELVSPANKDRASHRDAFVSKCAAFLQQGIGLIIVDVVTDRHANLHDELLVRLGSPEIATWEADLYACSYRPVIHDEQTSLDLWQQALTIGGALPTLPLWLPGGLCLPVDLEASYVRTCREHRISPNGS
jgi:hypothetical protein